MFTDRISTVPFLNTIVCAIEEADMLKQNTHPLNSSSKSLDRKQIEQIQLSANIRFGTNLVSSIALNIFVGIVCPPALAITVPVSLLFISFDLSSMIFAGNLEVAPPARK